MTKHYHFIGIGGIGMSALAHILLERGYQVSGSDLTQNYLTEKLARKGAHIFQGHAPDQVPDQGWVIYSTDISDTNPELREAQRKQLVLLHRSDLLKQLVEQSCLLAVTGTHGKTTTSALLAHALLSNGLDISFAVGGVLIGPEANARHGTSPYFVIEADESDGTFLKYSYTGAIVTNIDNDHLAHFGSWEKLQRAFLQFLEKAPERDLLFYCQDDPHLSALVSTFGLDGISYGFSEKALLRGSRVRNSGSHMLFDIHFQGTHFEDIEISLSGRHNVLNALAVFGQLFMLHISEAAIRRGLKTFLGVKRRMEKKGVVQGAVFIDDYAHHPTEVAATLQAQRAIHPTARLIAVYQPHRYSRMRYIINDFGTCFDAANMVLLTDLYTAGEAAVEGITTESIIAAIRKHCRPPLHYIPRKGLAGAIKDMLCAQDIVLTLGAGDITKVSQEIGL
jgi:UDP-N-acetylmuramate--alanine ligase